MIVGDLFSGIGGFSLAAHWMGWRTAWFSEIDPFASRVLAHHWPDVPNLGDITQVDWSTVAPVDVLTAGFPCQPHSLAGKRLASSDERDLFDEIIRAVRHLRPRYIVLENVRGLLTSESGRFFGRVLRELAACGYDVEWRVLSAADVGAPHKRERVWIVACRPFRYAFECAECEDCGEPWCDQHGEHYADCMCIGPHSEVVADSFGARLEGHAGDGDDARDGSEQSRPVSSGGLRGGGDAKRWWDTEPDVGRVAHGVSGRVDRLRCIGNAIVPACALEIFRSIEERDGLRRVA